MRPIGRGAAGPEVLDIQQRLEALGAHLGDDEPGVFGPGTESAVRRLQQHRGLLADGVVGDDTWRTLVEAGYALGDRLLYVTRPMLRGDDVRDLQQRLNRLGFDAGYVDGVFGPQTAEAVREFQVNWGLPDDGKAGADTMAALRRLHRSHQEAPAFAVRERAAMRERPRTTIAGVRVLVDPSHGPDEPGFLAPDGTTEERITWEIGRRLAGRLRALGAHVVLSRGPRTTPSTAERAELANREDVEAIVSIHCNGLPSPTAHGAAAYYYGSDGFVSERGRRLAQLCLDNVVATTGAPNCRTHPSSSGLLRGSRAPAVLVEPGFLTHPEEGRRLCEVRYQATVASALADAVVTFLLGGSPTGAATPIGEVRDPTAARPPGTQVPT